MTILPLVICALCTPSHRFPVEFSCKQTKVMSTIHISHQKHIVSISEVKKCAQSVCAHKTFTKPTFFPSSSFQYLNIASNIYVCYLAVSSVLPLANCGSC